MRLAPTRITAAFLLLAACGEPVGVQVPPAPNDTVPVANLIDAGTNATCAVAASSSIYCWGRLYPWQLPPGSANDFLKEVLAPQTVPINVTLTSIHVQGDHACGLTTAAGVYCWGHRNSGESYAELLATNIVFKSLSVGAVTNCGIDAQGALYCWGDDSWGQFGDGRSGTGLSSNVPVRVQLPEAVTNVDVAGLHVCAITISGTVFCWGRAGPWLGAGEVAWGGTNTPRPVSSAEKFLALDTWDRAGDYAGRTCAIAVSGVVYCWGTVGYFPESASFATAVPVPREVGGITAGHSFRSVSIGEDYACALERNGRATCWGTLQEEETRTPDPIPAALSFVDVDVGRSHACGITTSGATYCWGWRIFGQLGNGFSNYREMPTPVAGGLYFASIAIATASTCALTVAGELYCWGANGQHQLGDGTTTNRATPTPIAPARRFQSVAGDFQYWCAVDVLGQPYCWGTRYPLLFATTPTPIQTNLAFTTVTVGIAHACAITVDGTAYCWGENESGQLGIGDQARSELPRAVAGSFRFAGLYAKSRSTCGVTTTGEVYCWGRDDGGLFSSNAPVRISTATDAAEIGDQCYLTKAGDAYCWGLKFVSGVMRVPASQRLHALEGRGALDESGRLLFIAFQEPTSFSLAAAPGDLQFIAHSGKRVASGAGRLAPIDHACGIITNGRAYCWGDSRYGQLGDGEPDFDAQPVQVLTNIIFATHR